MSTLILTLNDVYELKNLPKLATLLKKVRKNHLNDTILVVVNGDFLAPSLLSSLDYGLNMVKAFNKLGVTHVCLGNHEFDNTKSVNVLRDNAKFKVINSNISGLPWTYPYDIVNEVLIVGGCLDMLNNPPGHVSSVNDTLIKVKNSLNGQYSYSVALTHQDYQDDMKLSGHFDVIMGGHDHDLMITHPVYKMGMDAEYLGVYNVEESKFWMYNVTEYSPDSDMMEFVEEEEMAVSAISKEKIISFSTTLSTKHVRTRQSTLARWFFEVLNEEYKVDGYIINSGSFRLEKSFKEMSLSDFRAMFPFNVSLHIIEMSSKTVKACISEGLAMSGDGMYPQYGFTDHHDYKDDKEDCKYRMLVSNYMLRPSKTYKCLKSTAMVWHGKEMPSILYMVLQKHRDQIVGILKDYFNTQEQSQVYEEVKNDKQLAMLFKTNR